MTNIFYSHLLTLEDLVFEVDKHELTQIERQEFLTLIAEIFHHQTLRLILDYLPRNLHEPFLSRLKKTPSDNELLLLLRREIKADIENEIKKQAQTLKKEILAEIKKAKKKKWML